MLSGLMDGGQGFCQQPPQLLGQTGACLGSTTVTQQKRTHSKHSYSKILFPSKRRYADLVQESQAQDRVLSDKLALDRVKILSKGPI